MIENPVLKPIECIKHYDGWEKEDACFGYDKRQPKPGISEVIYKDGVKVVHAYGDDCLICVFETTKANQTVTILKRKLFCTTQGDMGKLRSRYFDRVYIDDKIMRPHATGAQKAMYYTFPTPGEHIVKYRLKRHRCAYTLPRNAFSNLEELKRVFIPKNVRAIGDRCFYDTGLIEAVIGTTNSQGCGVKYLGRFAFACCNNLTTLKINKCRYIGEHAFEDCPAIKYVEIPRGCQKIGNFAFQRSGLQEVKIPKTTLIIGHYAFRKCTDLEKVKMGHRKTWESFPDETFNNFCSVNTFNGCGKLTELNFPFDNINRIKSSENITIDLSDMDSLTGLSFGKGIEYVRIGSRQDVRPLESITFNSDNIEKIRFFKSGYRHKDSKQLPSWVNTVKIFVPANAYSKYINQFQRWGYPTVNVISF